MSYTTGLGWTPVFQIDQGDDDITGKFQDRLISIMVESNSGGGTGDHLTIIVDDRDWAVSSPSTLSGNTTTLKVSLGYAEGVVYEMGTFNMDETIYSFPGKQISLHGNGIDFNSAVKSKVITSFEGKNVAQIIGSIAKAGGVTAVVDGEIGAQTIPFLNVHSSHMHLLQELERRFDGLAKIQDGVLSFTKRGTGLSASSASLGTFTLGPEDFGQFSVTERNRTAYSKVRVSYLDRTKNQLVWLQNTIATRFPHGVPNMVDQPFGSKDEAQAHANACMASLNRGTRTGSLTLAKGDPSIRGQQRFAIAGTRDGVDGQYVVTTATHTFRKDGGITTSLSFYDGGEGTSGWDSSESTPAITGQSFVPATGDDLNYSGGSSVGAGGQLGHV